ncbi:hypothetical protein OTU49_005134 [Cherax quadricarinatus]|uniref:Kinesin motor domain-containing protein n=1 Tax=Cherax quadricarinatus TaxID=27406 RepID=A0AAW0X7N8_CHEQU
MNRLDDRLSYLHASYTDSRMTQDSTFNPCKNLNDVFQSVSIEDVDGETLKVYLRVRPNLPQETSKDEDVQIDILDDHSIILTAPASSNTFKNSTHGITKLSQKFTFSHIYGPSTTQKDLFDTATLSLVRDFLGGQNCLLFTYGATNSGKTYTVQGTPTNQGILPRTLDVVFNTIGEHHYQKNDLKPQYFCSVIRLDEKDIQKEEERKERIFKIGSELSTTYSQSTLSLSKLSTSDDSLNYSHQLTEISAFSNKSSEISKVFPGVESLYHDNTSLDIGDAENIIYAVFVSFAEIYNEYVYDLLEKMPTSKKNKRNPLMLGEDRNGSIYIKGLQEVRVCSAEEAWKVLDIGRQNLHFATTRLNHNSSRSHCIFTIKVIKLAKADSPHVARVSMLSVCDLAGTERAGKTRSNQDRLKEASNINTSLLVLSRCIEALRRNQMQKGTKKREIPVPYRDSKLTRLFQSFFLGHGKAAMIVNISKTPLLFDETLQVLKFSAIAKQVAISQAKEEHTNVKISNRKSHFTSFVRQSLNSTGRLSVPWMKRPSDITFGASQRLKDQQAISEELTEWKLNALMKSTKKFNIHKRFRQDDDPDEEYVSSLTYFQEQHKVQEQGKYIQELETEGKHLKSEVEALKSFQKKTSELHHRSQEENARLTFQLSQLTENFDRVTKELEEMKRASHVSGTENLVIRELQHRLDDKLSLQEKSDNEIRGLKEMLVEAAETFITKEEECLKLEKQLEISEQNSTKQMMYISEIESVLEDARAMLSQQAARVEERDQYISELREQLSAQEHKECCMQLEKLQKEKWKIEEEYFSMNTSSGDTKTELRVAELLQERDALAQERHTLSNKLTESLSLFSHLQNVNSQLEKDNGLLKRQTDQLKNNINELNNKLVCVQEERASEQLNTSTFKVNCERAMNEANTFKNQLIEKNERILNLEMQVNELKETTNILQELENVNLELKDKIIALEATLKETELESTEYKNIKEKCHQLSESLEESQGECEEMRKERAQLQNMLQSEKKNKLLTDVNIVQTQEKINSLENDISQLKEEFKRKVNEMETLITEKEMKNASLIIEIEQINVLNKKLLSDKETTHLQHTQEILTKTAIIKEVESKNEMLMIQVQNIQSALENITESELKLQHISSQKDNKLEEMLSELKCKEFLEDEYKVIKLELEKHKEELMKLRSDFQAEKTLSSKNAAQISSLQDVINSKNIECEKWHKECEELKEEVEKSYGIICKYKEEYSEKAVIAQELLDLKAVNEELQNDKQMLEIKAQEKDSNLVDLKDSSSRLQLLLREAEEEKSKLEKQLIDQSNNEQHKIELEQYVEMLNKENAEFKSKCAASEELSSRQMSQLSNKDVVIAALNSKVQSLDCKLAMADEELEEDRMKLMQLDAVMEKCNIFEKEIRAVREARNEEVSQCSNQIEEQEKLLKQKEEEISSLQKEVKKLLQQSMPSVCGIDHSLLNETPKVKKETIDSEKDITMLKEQVRQHEAENGILKQEVNELKNQLEKMSLNSEPSILQCSVTTELKKDILKDTSISDVDITTSTLEKRGRKPPKLLNILRDASTSDMENTTTTSEKTGRKLRKPVAAAPQCDTLHVLDSSLGNESNSNMVMAAASPKPVRMSTKPQRMSRRVTRQVKHNDSFVYEDNPEVFSENDDDVWQPSAPTKRQPQRTRKPKGNKSKPQITNPHLKDQENNSSLANSAENTEPPQDNNEKPRVQRRKRLLYKSATDEPYQGSPNLVDLPKAVDSPHSIVRWQLRNKNK